MKTTKIHLFWGNIPFSIDLFLTCVPPFLALLKLSFQFRYFLGRIFWHLEFQIQILQSLLQRLRRDHVFGLRKCKQIEPFWFKNLYLKVEFSVQGVKSLGGHFACLCQGFDFYEVKKNIIFQKEKETLLHFLSFL